MDEALPSAPRKGRGAISNAAGRFEPATHVAIDDGWGTAGTKTRTPLETQYLRDTSKTVIARNNSPDVGFDRSINPYRGCEHGCIYCFARPTHAYLGLSAGLDFESRILVKEDAPGAARRELWRSLPAAAAARRCGVIPTPISRSSGSSALTRRFSTCSPSSAIR